jgi:5'-3' exonuclease
MGVPSFFRWIQAKYSKIIVPVVEEGVDELAPGELPGRDIDMSGANPNNIEFDNLYLDMNGIIHPCVHPEDGPVPDTEEKMFAAICRYIDRIVVAVRPRALLYLAIDGVAPRAKMNQQRSRRFKAAQEMQELEEIEAEKRQELELRGIHVPHKKKHGFDHNVITPGTGVCPAPCICFCAYVCASVWCAVRIAGLRVSPGVWCCRAGWHAAGVSSDCVATATFSEFMDKLSKYLRHYICDRLTNRWTGFSVIFSDANVPGEASRLCMCACVC